MMNCFGTYTAIVTPFDSDGVIDWQTLERLIEAQIAGGVTGLVPCGTTGEAPTLTEVEQLAVIKFVVERVKGRCQIIAGTGSNSTAHAVHLTRAAAEIIANGHKVDGALVVSPYYNKPTQEGLFRHFCAVAGAAKLPVVIYNIKGRTGVNIETETLLRIIEQCGSRGNPIAAIKEASGDLTQIAEVISMVPSAVAVLSGDDALTLEILKLGGKGVISVASNLFPERIAKLVIAGLAKDRDTAAQIHETLTPLYRVLFIETNPIPVKAALEQLGYGQANYRLPLCEIEPGNRAALVEVIRQLVR